MLTPWLDPFEAGPVVRAEVERLRTVRTSRIARIVALQDEEIAGPALMVSNRERERVLDYRVVMSPVIETRARRSADSAMHGKQDNEHDDALDGEVRLTTAAATALKVGIGDRVRIADLATSRRQVAVLDATEES